MYDVQRWAEGTRSSRSRRLGRVRSDRLNDFGVDHERDIKDRRAEISQLEPSETEEKVVG